MYKKEKWEISMRKFFCKQAGNVWNVRDFIIEWHETLEKKIQFHELWNERALERALDGEGWENRRSDHLIAVWPFIET